MIWICFWVLGINVQAAESVFSNAVSFYQEYGCGKIIFSEGAFYYASRGKAGNPKGIRYGVLGQKFTMTMSNGKTYEVGIALETSSNPGSCRRISYVKKDGYYYSLYKVSYDRILQRMQARYLNTEFEKMMYNQKIQCQIDFYLCLVKDGSDQGTLTELNNGRVQIGGTVYQKAEQIQKAANWSSETKEALNHYYGIQMQINQPSSWYAVYHKNDEAASGTMKKQEFTYGKTQKLAECSFKRVVTVRLDPGNVTWRGNAQATIVTLLKSRFLGWSLKEDGKIIYQDQQNVKNLSDRHGAVVDLYAHWSEKSMTLPEMKGDQMEFLGWSTKKVSVLPAGTREKDVQKLKLYSAGRAFSSEANTTLYAVWKWKQYKVQFQTPEDKADGTEIKKYYYNKEKIQQIREWIVSCGFVGNCFNEMISKRIRI